MYFYVHVSSFREDGVLDSVVTTRKKYFNFTLVSVFVNDLGNF